MYASDNFIIGTHQEGTIDLFPPFM